MQDSLGVNSTHTTFLVVLQLVVIQHRLCFELTPICFCSSSVQGLEQVSTPDLKLVPVPDGSVKSDDLSGGIPPGKGSAQKVLVISCAILPTSSERSFLLNFCKSSEI